VFHELLEARAVDKNHSGDIDILRLHFPKRVQASILITFYVDVMVTRLPTALGGRDRQSHYLTGVLDARRILRFVRPATLRKEYSRSRDHDQEHFHPDFGQDFHF